MLRYFSQTCTNETKKKKKKKEKVYSTRYTHLIRTHTHEFLSLFYLLYTCISRYVNEQSRYVSFIAHAASIAPDDPPNRDEYLFFWWTKMYLLLVEEKEERTHWRFATYQSNDGRAETSRSSQIMLVINIPPSTFCPTSKWISLFRVDSLGVRRSWLWSHSNVAMMLKWIIGRKSLFPCFLIPCSRIHAKLVSFGLLASSIRG